MILWPVVPIGWVSFILFAYFYVGDEDDQGPFSFLAFVPVFLMLLTKALP